MDYTEILYEKSEAVGTITLNNPAKINALSKNMVAELIHVFTAVSVDDEVKVILLKAAGKHFCAGHFIFHKCSCLSELKLVITLQHTCSTWCERIYLLISFVSWRIIVLGLPLAPNVF